MSKLFEILIAIFISFILLGLLVMILETLAVVPAISIPKSRALIPIIVKRQDAKAVETISVGEKASPFP